MVKIIRPDTINFHASITEDELKARLAHEVLEQIGALGPDGKRLQGVSVSVRRGTSRRGGYDIDVSGPVPARLLIAPPEE